MTDKTNRWDPRTRPEAIEEGPVLRQSEKSSLKRHSKKTPIISESSSPSGAKDGHKSECELNAIIGEGTSFNGTLSFSGTIRIDGEFSGRALGGQCLIVGKGAAISGELRAQKVIILGGTVEAEIAATESIEVYIPALVSGNLRSPQIYMDRGIHFEGTCDMTGDSGRQKK